MLAFWVCVGIAAIVIVFRKPLFKLLTDDPVVMHYAEQKLVMTAAFQFFYGLLDVLANAIRSLGRSTSAMFVNLFGVCVFRLIWLSTVFKVFKTYYSLCWAYPASFAVTFTIFLILYFPTFKQAKARLEREKTQEEEALNGSES
jgi:Na+-driven multidrug efflux pump